VTGGGTLPGVEIPSAGIALAGATVSYSGGSTITGSNGS